MKELLGLCSGRFSDSEDSRIAKNVETQDEAKRPQKGLTFKGHVNPKNDILGTS